MEHVLDPYAEVEHIAPEDFTPARVRDADALIVRTRTKINKELLDGSNVRFVATATIGYDHIDTSYCQANDIFWTNCPGCNSQAVCDYIQEVITCSYRNLIGTSWESQPDITLLSYAPNKLVYEAQTPVEQVAVFSEIYYPYDWHLYIDGEESPIYRVNYTLRAALIPQGKHELVMEFVPAALKTDKGCMAILIIAIVLSLAALCLHLFGKKSTCCPSVAESK